MGAVRGLVTHSVKQVEEFPFKPARASPSSPSGEGREVGRPAQGEGWGRFPRVWSDSWWLEANVWKEML